MAARAAFKFAPNIRELRLTLCQKSEASKGLRDFIETRYIDLKKTNPKCSFLVRECSGVKPMAYVRSLYGEETNICLEHLNCQQVEDTLTVAVLSTVKAMVQ